MKLWDFASCPPPIDPLAQVRSPPLETVTMQGLCVTKSELASFSIAFRLSDLRQFL